MQPNEQYDYARYESDELWQHEIKFTLCLILSRCLGFFFGAPIFQLEDSRRDKKREDWMRKRRGAAGSCVLWLIVLMDVSASGLPNTSAGCNGSHGALI